MEFYKCEKVNFVVGCLLVLLQILIFFLLYKVIFVIIELWYVLWIGWIYDMFVFDLISLWNLFGLLFYVMLGVGSFLYSFMLLVLVIVLGILMWMQQKLNLVFVDLVQKMIFVWMFWVFMFMLGGFVLGLVLYWIINNFIMIVQ